MSTMTDAVPSLRPAKTLAPLGCTLAKRFTASPRRPSWCVAIPARGTDDPAAGVPAAGIPSDGRTAPTSALLPTAIRRGNRQAAFACLDAWLQMRQVDVLAAD